MKSGNILAMCITCTVILCSSCNFASKNSNAAISADASVADSMKLNIDVANIDSMILSFTGVEKQFHIEGLEKETIGKALEMCTEDTVWNNDGKMRKMTAPDFKLTLHYSGKPANEISVVQVWQLPPRVQTAGKWYLFGMSGKELFAIVDTYNE
jgi:hypothetical protein